MISFTSIIGIFLVLFLLWFFTINDGPGNLVQNQQVEPTEISAEAEQLDIEDPEVKEFFRSNLKIISID